MNQFSPLGRQSLILGIVKTFVALSNSQQAEARSLLYNVFEMDPAAAVHSATEYALRMIGEDQYLATQQHKMSSMETQIGNWQILSNQLCMIKIRPTANQSINYDYEISATEVSVRQYQKYRRDNAPATAVTVSDDCPMNQINLYDAMKYCRWLNEQSANFDPDKTVYPPIEEIGPALRLDSINYEQLGFRLPTNTEWEYAARAGILSGSFYGATSADLSDYAWWAENAQEHLWTTGTKRPNPFGLFDVYGNTGEWCHVPNANSGTMAYTRRGGNYRSTSRLIDVSLENSNALDRFSINGFRIVRIKHTSD